MADINGTRCFTPAAINIFFNARLFLREMVYWSRTFFGSVFHGVGSESEVFARLYYTPTNFGQMLRLVIPRQFADYFEFLFQQYTVVMRELVTDVVNGQQENINEKVTELYSYFQQIEEFLIGIFPSIDRNLLRGLLWDYVTLEIEMINAYTMQDYSKIIQLYDDNISNADDIADQLARGIMDYITVIPATQESINGKELCLTYEELDVILDIAMFWVDLISWFRAYRISVMANVGDQDELYNRLIRATTDFGDLLKQFVSPEIVDPQIALIQEYIDLMNRMLEARMAGDIDEMNRAYNFAVDNIHARAEFLGEVFPGLSAQEWENQLTRMHSTLVEMGGEFLSGNFARNIALFDDLINIAEDLGFVQVSALLDLLFSGNRMDSLI